MKQEEFPKRLYIPQPFASGDADARITAELKPIANVTGTDVNFVDGFPSVYSSPLSQGGKLVSRGEINAIGNLASVNEYYYRCGGLNTFDPELAMKIGGYSRGAVLEILEGLDYHKVVSLVDDNKMDFNSDALTPQQIAAGITLGSIDGVNWAYCANGTIDDSVILFELGDRSTVDSETNAQVEMIGAFTARKNGMFGFEGNFVTQRIDSSLHAGGVGIVCMSDVTKSPSQAQGSVIYSRGNWNVNVGVASYGSAEQTVMDIRKGHKYSLYVLRIQALITNSTFKIKLIG